MPKLPDIRKADRLLCDRSVMRQWLHGRAKDDDNPSKLNWMHTSHGSLSLWLEWQVGMFDESAILLRLLVWRTLPKTFCMMSLF